MASPASATAGATTSTASISSVHLLLKDPNTFIRHRVRSFPFLLQTQSLVLISGLFSSSPAAAGILLRLSSALAPLNHSLLLFHHLPSPIPAFSLNSLLHSISLVSLPSFTIPFFSSVLNSLYPSFTPNSFTFLPLITSCARAKTLSPGTQLHAQSLRRGIIPSFHVTNALIHFYSNCGHSASARKLFDEMPDRDIVSYNTIIEACISQGDINSANEVFDEMGKRNVVSWNILINGYVKLRKPEQALEIFREMKRIRNLKGTAATMVIVVTACARLGRVNSGKEIHGFYLRNFEEDNLIFWTALVDMYGKCRKVETAHKVFDQINKNKRNLISWNAMIISHCVYGDPLKGIKLFDEFVGNDNDEKRKLGLPPDGVTFIGVLCACARVGLLEEGQNYFDQMTKLYKLKPTFAHYWCLANLYKSRGLLKEAQNILKFMPLNTSSKALAGLLGLCKFSGEFELGERIAKSLVELDSGNNSYKALLCSVYVASGKWKEARKVKKEIKGILKEEIIRVGHRLMDLNEITTNFELYKEVYLILDELVVKLTDKDENN